MFSWYLESARKEDGDCTYQICLKEVKEYAIGRRLGLDIVSANPLVSRNHAIVYVRDVQNFIRITIKDLHSSNGIWINDVRIPPNEEYKLESDDLIGIGAPSTVAEKKELFRLIKKPIIGQKINYSLDNKPDKNKIINDCSKNDSDNSNLHPSTSNIEIDKSSKHIENTSQQSSNKSLISDNCSDSIPKIEIDVIDNIALQNHSAAIISSTSNNIASTTNDSAVCVVQLNESNTASASDKIGSTVNDDIVYTNSEVRKQSDITNNASTHKIATTLSDTVTTKNIQKHSDVTTVASTTNIASSKAINIKCKNSQNDLIKSSNENKEKDLEKVQIQKNTEIIEQNLQHLQISASNSLNKISNSSVNNIALEKCENQSKFMQKEDDVFYILSSDDENENATTNASGLVQVKTEIKCEESDDDLFIINSANDETDNLSKTTESRLSNVKIEKTSDNVVESLSISSDVEDMELITTIAVETEHIKNEPNEDIQNANELNIINSESVANVEEKMEIKIEPNQHSYSFSVEDVDIIELSDDDDNFPKSQLFDGDHFPKSQLFDDIVLIKEEPLPPIHILSDDEQSNERYGDNIFDNIKNEENDDYESEEDIWYQKLSQSQLHVSDDINEATKCETTENQLAENDLIKSETNGENSIQPEKQPEPVVVNREIDLIFPEKDIQESEIRDKNSVELIRSKKSPEVQLKKAKKDLKGSEKPSETDNQTNEVAEIVTNVSTKEQDKKSSTRKNIIRSSEPVSYGNKADSRKKTNERSKRESETSTDSIFDLIGIPKLSEFNDSIFGSDSPVKDATPEDTVDNAFNELLTEVYRKDETDITPESSTRSISEENIIKQLSRFRSESSRDIDEESKSSKDEFEPTTKLTSKKKPTKPYVKPPVIDAPFLVKGKRKAHDPVKKKEIPAKRQKRLLSEDDRIETRSHRPSTIADKKVREEFDKRNKKRGKTVSESITKLTKQQIAEERKKKLKELSLKQKESKKDEVVTKHPTKPKVKVSESRGLFLVDKDGIDDKRKLITHEEVPKKKAKYVIPKRQTSSLIGNKPSTSKPLKCDTENLTSNTRDSTSRRVTEILNNKIKNGASHTVKKLTNIELNELNKEVPHIQLNGIHKTITPIIECPTSELLPDRSKQKKRVSFNVKPQIKYYDIAEGCTMRKINSKDAPLPKQRIRPDACPTEHDTITSILQWVPMWLEEQKTIDSSPKLSAHPPIQMLHTFNTLGDYYNIVTPLMLLELWKTIYSDWLTHRFAVVLTSIDDIRDVSQSKLKNSLLNCHCVMSRQQLQSQYFSRGDLIIVEMVFNDKLMVSKKFGFIKSIQQRRLTKNDYVNPGLIKNVIPEFILHFQLLMREFNTNGNFENVVRVRLVSRLNPHLRTFRSVSNLYQSSLCPLILKPKIEDYKMARISEMSLKIKDELDKDQLQCVIEACQMCLNPNPGIYMIQGPPGTGKSTVITNIVLQLLHGHAQTNKIRILVVAPSNGAIDELCNKLLDIREKFNEKKERFKMIRMGPKNSIHPRIKNISLQVLVEKHIKSITNNCDYRSNDALSENYNFLESKINSLENKLLYLTDNNADRHTVINKITAAKQDLESFKARCNKDISMPAKYKLERQNEEIITEGADIICTTLSSCMGSIMEDICTKKNLKFTCCIVDEATQSNEQETLIPLMLGINKLILVGDPAQLNATVMSQEAKQLGYGTSLFSRIQTCMDHLPENPIRMLKTQYRMHAEICKFPSETFYSGQLVTSELVAKRNHCLLNPYKLLCFETVINFGEGEYINKTEVDAAIILAKSLLQNTDYTIGIVTPYAKQKDFIKQEIAVILNNVNQTDESRISVNTVDGFQGQERDVIIISCVRISSNSFLSDKQRMNVSLTRAKYALYILAHSQLFRNDTVWRKLMFDAGNRYLINYINDSLLKDEKYMTALIWK